MANDETIWNCINHGDCSFKVKVKAPKATFCRNEFNVTGSCNRVSCPLANGQYATVIEKEGECFLLLKTVERAHLPKDWWQKIKLSKSFAEALEQVNHHMTHWPDHMKNRCKQRLTKIRQMMIRMRKLEMQTRMKMVADKPKTRKRESAREEKAERAAQVELAIEKELLERLKQGTYGDIYNFPRKQFEKIVDENEESEEEVAADSDEEMDKGDGEMEGEFEFVEGSEDEAMMSDVDSEFDGHSDVETDTEEPVQRKPKAKKGVSKRPRVEIEYEMEDAAPLMETH